MSVALSAALGLLLVANAGPVQWSAGACDAPDAQATLTELLALEIRAMPPEAGVFLTFTACDLMGPTVLVALIDHGPRQPPERLVLPLGSIDRSARARAAALAIAESIRAAERAPPAPPTSAPTATPAPTAVAAPARLSLGASGALGYLARYDAAAFGAAVDAAWAAWPWLRLGAELGWRRAKTSTALGEVRLDVAELALFAAATARHPRFALWAGPGVTLGLAWAQGQSARPAVPAERERATTAGVGLRVGAEVPLGAQLSAALTGSAGWTLRGLEAQVDGQPTLGHSGLVVTLRVGLRWAFAP